MDMKQEMTAALINEETLDKARGMLSGNMGEEDIVSLDIGDMMYRLFRTPQNTINLEFLMSASIGSEENEKSGNVQSNIRCFKPIGFFDSNTPNKKDLNVFFLKEFESDIQNLECPPNVTFKKLSLSENAVIAAFSIETMTTVLEILKKSNEMSGGFMPPNTKNIMLDRSIVSNGLDIDLFMSMQGYPQAFLDDKYNLEGAISGYQPMSDGGFNIYPTTQFEAEFNKLQNMSLMSAFKRI